jgi:transposase
MPQPDLSHLSSDEKDTLIFALLDRVAAIEAKLDGPPRIPDNSSVPPSRGQKANRPPRPKKLRRNRDGPGTARDQATDPDRSIDCHARTCAYCGTALGTEGQHLRLAYDHIDLPPIRPVVTRVRIFGRRCPGCQRPVGGDDAGLPAPSPRGRLRPAVWTVGGPVRPVHQRGAFANALRRSSRILERSGAAIVERLRSAMVTGCDETGARLTTDTLGARMG